MLPIRRPQDAPGGPVAPPWFPGLESPRLSILPVQDRKGLVQAFELISIPEVGSGMEFPEKLSLRQFEIQFHRGPRKDIFLLLDRDSSQWAVLVIFWPLPGREGWHQILYGILPEKRGRGLALEGCRALLDAITRARLSNGMAAKVAVSNQASRKIARGLGMTLAPDPAGVWWEIPIGAAALTLPQRLWSLVAWESVPRSLFQVAARIQRRLG